MLEAHDDVYDESLGTPTNPAQTPGENATDEDVVAPEVTEELNRQSLQSPERQRTDALEVRVQTETQRTAG